MNDADQEMWIQVYDVQGSPLEDVTIYGYFSLANNTADDEFEIFTRRLTPPSGLVFHPFDSNTTLHYIISKSGYTSTIYTEYRLTGNTMTTPVEIYLTPSAAAGDQWVNVWISRTFYNRSQDMVGMVIAIDRDTVQYTP